MLEIQVLKGIQMQTPNMLLEATEKAILVENSQEPGWPVFWYFVEGTAFEPLHWIFSCDF